MHEFCIFLVYTRIIFLSRVNQFIYVFTKVGGITVITEQQIICSYIHYGPRKTAQKETDKIQHGFKHIAN
jgi:hypothetical protein